EYHRPVRPGDVLTVTSHPGKTWEREGRRGGTMTFAESVLEYRDQHGEQVVVDNLTRTQIVQYAGASGDYNPLHSDEIFATQVAGYPSIFAHGMLTMGVTGRMLTDYVGDGR